MDFNTKELQSAIGKLKGLINTKSPYPAIRGVLYADGNLRATDMNVHAKVSVSTGLISTDEKFIIPEIAFNAIGKLSAQTTNIETDVKNNIVVSSGKFKTTFASFDPKDFPTTENVEYAVSADILFAEFVNALDAVSYATSIDEKKGVLCGVNIASNGVDIIMTALDGFRAATAKFDCPQLKTFIANVPDGFWKALAKISSGEEKVTFSVAEGGKNVSVKGEQFEVITRTLEGQFPDVAKIINGVNPDKSVTVTKDDILHALDLHSAAIKDSGANNLVVLTVNAEESALVFSARSEVSNFKFEISAECDGFDAPFTIGFNSRYLTDAIKALNAEDIRINLKAPVAATLVHNADKPDSAVALVLPVRING